MTEDDSMPFGKYRGQPIKSLPLHYRTWLANQDNFEEQHPELHAALLGRKQVTFDDAADEAALAAEAPEGFVDWWWPQHGRNLRRTGGLHYAAMMRVAMSAWSASKAHHAAPSDEDIPY